MLVNIKCAAFIDNFGIWGELQFMLACRYPVLTIHCDILTFVFENRVKLQFMLVNYHSPEFFVKFFSQILVLNAM